MTDRDRTMLTAQQVASIWQVSEETVWRMARSGRIIGAAKVGHSWRFDARYIIRTQTDRTGQHRMR